MFYFYLYDCLPLSYDAPMCQLLCVPCHASAACGGFTILDRCHNQPRYWRTSLFILEMLQVYIAGLNPGYIMSGVVLYERGSFQLDLPLCFKQN